MYGPSLDVRRRSVHPQPHPNPPPQVMASLPLVCVFFPLDALGSILDGSLLAAKQSNFMSAVQVGRSRLGEATD
jgi:hypothetical protein